MFLVEKFSMKDQLVQLVRQQYLLLRVLNPKLDNLEMSTVKAQLI